MWKVTQDLIVRLYPIKVTQQEVQEAYSNMMKACNDFHLPDTDHAFHKLTGCDPLQYGDRMIGEKFGRRVKAMCGAHGFAVCKMLLAQYDLR